MDEHPTAPDPPRLAATPQVDAHARQLVVTMAHAVRPESVAMALLDALDETTGSYRLPALPRDDADTRLVADIAKVRPGRYLVRVEVDGISSVVQFEGGRIVGPSIFVPAFG